MRGVERVGGFGGKSDILAEGAVFAGNPGHFQQEMTLLEAPPPRHSRRSTALASGRALVLTVQPFNTQLAASRQTADRSSLPEPDDFPTVRFDDFARAQLANGLKIVLAERHAVPVVHLTLMMDAGFAADQLGRPGTASIAMSMLDEGTDRRSALQISGADRSAWRLYRAGSISTRHR